jgi:DNA-binding GntR family transcriptional regulator
MASTARGAITRAVLGDQVREALLERILDGQYPPGTRLVETQLAKEFGISQAPVREALRDLEAMRLVEAQPFHGTYVRELAKDELVEVYPVRTVLEDLAARLATPRLAGEVTAIAECLDTMRAAEAEGDTRSAIEHHVRFHRLIVEAAGNSILLHVWQSLAIEARTRITFMAGEVAPGALWEQHVPILRALERQDADDAAAQARIHFEQFGREPAASAES